MVVSLHGKLSSFSGKPSKRKDKACYSVQVCQVSTMTVAPSRNLRCSILLLVATRQWALPVASARLCTPAADPPFCKLPDMASVISNWKVCGFRPRFRFSTY